MPTRPQADPNTPVGYKILTQVYSHYPCEKPLLERVLVKPS